MQATLSTEARKAVVKITELYRDFAIGMSTHQAKAQLGKHLKVVDSLVANRYLKEKTGKYFPCFRALDFLPPDEKQAAYQSTDLVPQGIEAALRSTDPRRRRLLIRAHSKHG